MVLDLGLFDRPLFDAREGLDHRLLDEIPDLGPATLENLSEWIWRRLSPVTPGLARVTVYRDSNGESCSYFGPNQTEQLAQYSLADELTSAKPRKIA
jgi:6-pyruvoyltetrahydropterin/6-carboxytetrahydropterin synthase